MAAPMRTVERMTTSVIVRHYSYCTHISRGRMMSTLGENVFTIDSFPSDKRKEAVNPRETGQTPSLTKRAKKKLHKFQMAKQHKQTQNNAVSQIQVAEDDAKYGQDFKPATDYYFQNGLRKVYPYYYTFSSYVKGRWMGREILEVFLTEFRSDTPENYKRAIEQGLITVNGKAVPTNFLLGENQLLSHTCHRHENPVLDTPMEILVDNDEVLVINKPCSVPCHPCGRYRYNTITYILGLQFGYWNLRTLHRLDRLTSGVLILPKTHGASSRMEKQLRDRLVEKEYVCRVVGKFPDGKVDCQEPVVCLSHKLSLYKVSRNGGKASHTTFWRLSYNGETSVVKCLPHTGRTHQIRVHLQFLGHPIINDPFYNSKAFGPNRGKGGIFDQPEQKVADAIMKEHNIGLWVDGENPVFLRKQQEQKEAEEKANMSQVADSVDSAVGTSEQESSVLSTENSEPTVQSSDVLLDSTVCQTANSNCMAQIHREIEPPAKRLKKEKLESSVSESRFSFNTMDCGEQSAQDANLGKMKYETVREPSVGDKNMGVSTESLVTMESSTNTKTGVEASASRECTGIERKMEHPGFEEKKLKIDVNCDDCRLNYIDPQPKCMILYLHALRYKGPDWEYKTSMPDWAQENWTEPE